MRMKPSLAVAAAVAALAFSAAGSSAVESDASAPKGVTISAYDTGFSLVSELRSVTLAKGENVIRFRRLPSLLDPSTVSFSTLGGGGGLDVQSQQFQYDLADVNGLFNRYVGRPIEVATGSDRQKGVLLSVPTDPEHPLAIRTDDGAVQSFTGDRRPEEVVFPDAARSASLEPTLIWRATAAQDGPQNLRLFYGATGLQWDVSYEAVLADDGSHAFLTARANLSNRSGGSFENARVRLVSTEQGRQAQAAAAFARVADTSVSGAPLRYKYGFDEPIVAQAAAGKGALATCELPRPVTLASGESVHDQFASAEKLPVTRFYVYDGVVFDRFQRNRRNDWNYGTEFQSTVEMQLEFVNAKAYGLGRDLPVGRFRLYQQKSDGTVELLGDDVIAATEPEKTAHLLVGPARGLKGERERTGYSEVTPLHEYEESFEIRLENDSDQEVEIRVLEHLYRWSQFEIVKADTEYTKDGEQRIEFRPVLKPGGRRAVHYTVRYRW